MLDTVCTLILMFFVFSCAGWIMEVVLKYFEFHRFINRGFLIGPYCPIYGFGVVAVTVVVGGMVGRHGTLGEVFFAGMVMCGALEYFTSWYMEKMFHARWWDYSAKPDEPARTDMDRQPDTVWDSLCHNSRFYRPSVLWRCVKDSGRCALCFGRGNIGDNACGLYNFALPYERGQKRDRGTGR